MECRNIKCGGDNIRKNKHEKCTIREMAYGIYSGGGHMAENTCSWEWNGIRRKQTKSVWEKGREYWLDG